MKIAVLLNAAAVAGVLAWLIRIDRKLEKLEMTTEEAVQILNDIDTVTNSMADTLTAESATLNTIKDELAAANVPGIPDNVAALLTSAGAKMATVASTLSSTADFAKQIAAAGSPTAPPVSEVPPPSTNEPPQG
jgi:septation ring formation regulator EzrA